MRSQGETKRSKVLWACFVEDLSLRMRVEGAGNRWVEMKTNASFIPSGHQQCTIDVWYEGETTRVRPEIR